MSKFAMLKTAALFFALTVSISANALADSPKPVNVPAGELTAALDLLEKQSGVEIVYRPELLKGLRTSGVKGTLSSEDAVTKLLKGTTLKLQSDRTGVLLITEAGADGAAVSALGAKDVPAKREDEATPRDRLPLAQTDQRQDQGAISVGKSSQNSSESSEGKKGGLEEIVVTGTHIRGVTDSPAPVHVYTRDDIDRSGVGTVAEFIQRLPQNFNGGASESTFYSGGGNASDSTFASGVNLRGLGNDATLVLLDGNRMAPGNVRGNITDISMIPLSAVDRIEIVTDGASAIYGADAVGGVVNFILRKDFQGAETRATYGGVSNGGSRETEIGQTVGRNWTGGSALANYEYYDRTPLSAADRSYSQGVPLPFELLPEQVRQSALLSLTQSLTSNVDVFGDASYSHRGTTSFAGIAIPGANITLSYPTTVDLYNGSVGSHIALNDKLQVELSASYGRSASHITNTYLYRGTIGTNADFKATTTISSFDAKLDGPLFALPSGLVMFAAGSQYRRETYDYRDIVHLASYSPARTVTAGFVELRVPLVGPSSGAANLPRVELNLAGRLEHYGDVGSSSNPSIGLTWNVGAGVRLRGTFGRSFKAPNLFDLNPTPREIFIYPSSVIGGGPNTLFVSGGNPDLKPETAKTWTIGLDLKPSYMPGFNAKVTFFSIKFTDEIVDPESVVRTNHLFQFQSILGPSILNQNPSSAEIDRLIASPSFVDVGYGGTASNVGAIFDTRSHNLSSATTSGLDLALAYRGHTLTGSYELGVDGTYIRTFENKFLPTAPENSILNTPYNPINIKARGHTSYTYGPVTITAFVNYTNRYTDDRITPPVSVASWTTADLTASYRFLPERRLLGETVITLAVLNVANRDPPYLLNTIYPVNYDGANANPLGRFLSVQLTHKW